MKKIKSALATVALIVMTILVGLNLICCVGSACMDLFINEWTSFTVLDVVAKLVLAVGGILLHNLVATALGFEYPDNLSVDEASQPS